MNWDDIRVVRAVYQAGSYGRAAEKLQVNETTVARRIARLEDDLGVTLFDMIDGARQPTDRCTEIMSLSETMASHAERIANIRKTGPEVVERRRIAATDSVSSEVLAPRAPAFLQTEPGLALDLLASTENVDFSRWQADLAVRLKEPEKGDFIMSKLISFDLFFFAPAQVKEDQPPLPCAYPEDLDLTPESRYLKEIGLQDCARLRTKNLIVMKQFIHSGTCQGILPSYMCADLMNDPSLIYSRLPEPREAWLLIQQRLKDDPLTRRVIDWIRECFDIARGSATNT